MVQMFLIISRHYSVISVENMFGKNGWCASIADKFVIICGKFRNAFAAEVIFKSGFFLDNNNLLAQKPPPAKMTGNAFG